MNGDSWRQDRILSEIGIVGHAVRTNVIEVFPVLVLFDTVEGTGFEPRRRWWQSESWSRGAVVQSSIWILFHYVRYRSTD